MMSSILFENSDKMSELIKGQNKAVSEAMEIQNTSQMSKHRAYNFFYSHIDEVI